VDVLVVPPAAQRDEKAVQMLSAWVAENGLHCTMKIGMWRDNGHDEAESWGILLADVVRHVANAMRDKYGEDPAATASMIADSLLEELGDPTSETKGGFQSGVN